MLKLLFSLHRDRKQSKENSTPSTGRNKHVRFQSDFVQIRMAKSF